MAAPPNISAATADVLTLPASITLDVTEAPNYQAVWFSYAATATTVLSLFAWADTSATAYEPRVSIWTGDVDSLSIYLSFTDATASAWRPLAVPVTAGTTYYIKVRNDNDASPSDAVLVLTAKTHDTQASLAGALFINDDTYGYPAVVLDPTDGSVLRYVNPFPYGEMGAVVSNGRMLFKADDRSKLALYDETITLMTEVSGAVGVHTEDGDDYIDGTSAWYPQITSDNLHTFYVVNVDAYDGEKTVRTVSDEGVVGGTVWTLPGTGVQGGTAVSPDGSILYYGEWANHLSRYDLVNNTALSDFGSGPAGFQAAERDLIVLSDGSVIVPFHGDAGTSPLYGGSIVHYDASGTVLATWDMNANPAPSGTDLWYLNRLARDVTDDTFWVWRFGITSAGYRTGVSRFDQIRVSDGASIAGFTLNEFNKGKGPWYQGLVPDYWGPSNSCPFVVLRAPLSAPSESVSPSASEEAPLSWTLTATGTVTWQGIPPGQNDPRLIRRLRQTPHLSSEQVRLFFSRLELDLEAGVGLSEGQGVDPQVMLQWSDDGGHTWSNEYWVSAGKQGEYKRRAIWRRLGSSRDRVWRFVVSDPCKWVFLDAYVDVTKGTA